MSQNPSLQIPPSKAVLGIDPGKTGAAFVISESRVSHMLRFGKGDWRDVANWIHDIRFEYRNLIVGVERVGTRPDDDVVTAFKFGYNTGIIHGILLASGLSFQLVESKTWQYAFGLGGRRLFKCKHDEPACEDCEYAERKRHHKMKAQELFQDYKVTLDMSDAMLIAEHLFRLEFGYEKRLDEAQRRLGTGITRIVTRS